ncbi:MAG: pilus assembly protein PilM [Spirochaetota bacterium]
MFENIASIDIGTSSIKVVTVKTGLKDFKVKNFIYEDIDQENENKEEALLEALGKIISENNLKDYKILTSLPMQKAVIRNMTFPFNDKDKIAEVLPIQAEEAVPFRLEDIVLDFQMLKGKTPDEGEILLAVAEKSTIQKQISYYNASGINPVSMGIESQALFECYRYFNRMKDEAIIQLDIGNAKTILNIVHGNNLLFTRSIAIGAGTILNEISDTLKLQKPEIKKLFEEYNFDLNSFENNLQKNYPDDFSFKKNTLKKIHEKAIESVNLLIEEIIISKKAFLSEYPEIVFNRILISGGGANITGIGSIISAELEAPVMSLPFLDEYKDSSVSGKFPIAFGIVLSYLNKRYTAISFLKDEFLPASSGSSVRQYYLAILFFVFALVILVINISVTSYINLKSNTKYAEILNDRFKKYFHSRNVSDDPVADAMKILKDEKKEFESIDSLIHSNDKMISILNDILSFFPRDELFELTNLVLNENIIRLDGRIASSVKIDEFKNKLTESKKFDSVTVKTSLKKGNLVQFTMNIKLKIIGKKSEI